MRNIRNIIGGILIPALTFFISCSKVELADEGIYDGDIANVSVSFNVNAPVTVETKAAQSTYYEYLVQNIYVFVFNSSGNRVQISKNFFEPGDIADYINKEDAQKHTESSGTLTFNSAVGSNMRICLIANIGTSNSKLPYEEMTKAAVTDESNDDVVTKTDIEIMDAISSYSELQNLTVSLKENTVSRGGSFLMTGEALIQNFSGNITETVLLYRTDSKITFNVTAAKNIKFTPGRWRVVNIPLKSWVLPPVIADGGTTLTQDLDATSSTDASDYFSIAEDQMLQFESNIDDGATFTFYMYENLKAPQNSVNSNYALREKRNEQEAFMYAHNFATYVEFTGEISYTNEKGQNVMANARYFVHLGQDSHSKPDSYNTMRNTHYTYKVKINGVDDLIVEVVDNNERRPGAEGDVVISGTKVITVDGHYGKSLITLTPEDVADMTFSIVTPFESGVNSDESPMKDYKWVKFLINSEAGVGNDVYAPFPGEQCYDGGESEKGKAPDDKPVLRDVKQLAKYFKDNPPKSDVTLTVFIDEYLYFYHPLKGTYNSVNSVNISSDDLLLWKESVNKDNRALVIGSAAYSEDGRTTLVAKAIVSINQRPILTFYNIKADGLLTAWGTEFINETPLVPKTRTSYPRKNTNESDYLYAQRTAMLNGSSSNSNLWENVVSSTPATNEGEYTLGDDYKDPSYACVSRNRDLNGNGTIDQNEMLWYLTSLDQLADLWIGEPAMPPYAVLYDPENPDGKYNRTYQYRGTFSASHYASSSIYNQSAPYIYWGEEYGGTSYYGQWGPGGQYNTGQHMPTLSVRCIRNLGTRHDDYKMPQDYIQVKNKATGELVKNITPGNTNSINTEYTISLQYIDPRALRSNIVENGSVPFHLLSLQQIIIGLMWHLMLCQDITDLTVVMLVLKEIQLPGIELIKVKMELYLAYVQKDTEYLTKEKWLL